jgi:hypothetical protein
VSESRLEIIASLVELSGSLEPVAARVRVLEWDYEGETVVLRRAHIVSVLNRYQSGELSDVNIERWANLLEGREDISFEPGHEDWLDEVIFQLANPGMTVALDAELAAKFIAEATR